MTPTNKLRFVERKIYYDEMEESSQIVCTLQQWWEDEDRLFDVVTKAIKGEWRDVPVEKEE